VTGLSTIGIDVRSLGSPAIYKLLVGSVVPRPIAWVTTLNAANKVNLAPFSFFTVVSTDPPLLLVNCERRGALSKDTAVNAQRQGELVINVVSESLASPVHASSVAAGPEESEAELLNLELLPSATIKTPYLADAPISIECRLDRILHMGRTPNDVLIAEAQFFHVRRDLYSDGKIDMRKLLPLARLGGPTYARLGEFLELGTAGPLGSATASRFS
jgi:flavin reductase (DIM6/NTAB) family NADH-FMN oxidoreductase RutF